MKRAILGAVIVLICILTGTNCAGDGHKRDANKALNDMIEGTKLPIEYIGWGARTGHQFIRIITSGSQFFSFRKPDYDGGFYIYFQTGVLDAPYEATEVLYRDISSVDFDALAIKSYIVHFQIYSTDDASDSTGDVSFHIPDFYGGYLELNSPLEYNTFNPDSVAGEKWTPCGEWFDVDGITIQMLMLFAILNKYTYENREPILETDYETGLDAEIADAANERCDFALIHQLNQSGRFDTIFHQNGSTFYANTDLERYELPADPDVFYVIYRKFHANGKLKEKKRFYPGVYRNVGFYIGYSLYFKADGRLANAVRENRMAFLSGELNETTIIWFLEEEGWINTRTGDGKATFAIDEQVNPHAITHGGSRFVIRAPWEAQFDDDLEGTVGILISKNNEETSYIINKSSGTILKKFRR